MASRIFALFIWAAVAASLAYWGLRWLARPTGVPANATPVSMDSGAHGDLRRLLAGPAKAADGPVVDPSATSALVSRLKLLGVVAPRHEGDTGGVALLSLDGKPPKAVRIGGVIEGDMVLKSLTQRGASFGTADGPATATLDLPLLPPPAMGSLPPVSGFTTEGPGHNPNRAISAGHLPGAPMGTPGALGRLSGQPEDGEPATPMDQGAPPEQGLPDDGNR